MRCTKLRQFAILLLAMTTMPGMAVSAGWHPSFEVTGVVVKNHDGDTIKLETEDRGVLTIRISGADTPETGQAYWRAARGYLRKLVAGKATTAWCYKKDPHDREVCHVRVGDRDVSEALIASGHGWYARMFAGEFSEAQQLAYDAAEQSARNERLPLLIHLSRAARIRLRNLLLLQPQEEWRCREPQRWLQQFDGQV